MKLVLIVLFCSCNLISFSQDLEHVRNIDSSLCSFNIDRLRHLYGFNKKIPAEYELHILLALSYYHELDSTIIVFKKSKIKTTLNARPTIFSLLFKKKSKRKYIIRINNNKTDSTISLNYIPFNAKIGLFGHEFNHLIDYKGKNIFQIIGRLIAYTNLTGKEKFEKEIDHGTISRGLGWQLYDWAFYVINSSNVKYKYKMFKKQVYLEPEEILEIMGKS